MRIEHACLASAYRCWLSATCGAPKLKLIVSNKLNSKSSQVKEEEVPIPRFVAEAKRDKDVLLGCSLRFH